jgi:hypothetical protein
MYSIVTFYKIINLFILPVTLLVSIKSHAAHFVRVIEFGSDISLFIKNTWQIFLLDIFEITNKKENSPSAE